MNTKTNLRSCTSILLIMFICTGITLAGQADTASKAALAYCEPFDTEIPESDSFSGFQAVGRTEILKRQEASEYDSLMPLDNLCAVSADVYS